MDDLELENFVITRCNDKGYDTMGWSEMRCDVFQQMKLEQTDETKL